MYIVLNNGQFKPPGDCYYLVASNGVFIIKENKCFSASVKVDECLKLQKHSEGVKWKLPKIPSILAQRAVNFFRYVREKVQSEGLLWIYYSPADQEDELFAPVQKVSNVSVSTEDKTPTPDGWLKIGTMHSHPTKAFHSGGDDEDEKHFDGLHITVGDLDQIIPDFSCSVVVSGRRFMQSTEHILDFDTAVCPEFISKVRPIGGK